MLKLLKYVPYLSILILIIHLIQLYNTLWVFLIVTFYSYQLNYLQ